MNNVAVLAAADSFKGTLTSRQVNETVAAVLTECGGFSVVCCPVADGGEGTAEALTDALGGETVTLPVTGPFGQTVNASYRLAGTTAVLEMAAASGITLQPKEELDPLVATTYGTGELLNDALARGAEKILIGIGGSATNDGGAGALQALGAKLYDAAGRELPRGGAALRDLASFDATAVRERFKGVDLQVACDVTSPLCGPNGATAVFSAQKGASEADKRQLETALLHYGTLVDAALGHPFKDLPGTGAAGGLGYALVAFCGGKLRRGFDVVADAVGLEEKIGACDVVITGEGRTDASSLLGKLPVSVAALAKKHGKECVLISGDLACDEGALDAAFSAHFRARRENDTPDEAMANAIPRLRDAAARAARFLHNERRYKTLLLDLDNTLLDFAQCAYHSMKRGFEERGLPFSDDSFAIFERENNKIWKELEAGGFPKDYIRQNRWNRIFAALGIDADGPAFEEVFEGGLADFGIPMDGAQDLLEYLAPKYDLYVVSNGFRAIQKSRLKLSGFEKYFKGVFLSEDLGVSKPAAEYFDACFRAMGNPAKETVLLVGDSLTADISGGERYGIDTVWVNLFGESAGDLHPTFVIRSPAELKSLL